MNFSEAYNLLISLTNSDSNAKHFKLAHEQFQKKNQDEDIKSYLDFIKGNCIEWFEGMPTKWASASALAKPKMSIIKLLEQPQVHQAYGAEFCIELEKIIEKTWKDNKDKLVSQRAVTSTINPKAESTTYDGEEAYIEEDFEEDVEEDAQQRLEVLQQENRQLRRDMQEYKSCIEDLKTLFVNYVKIKEDPGMQTILTMFIEKLR